MRSKMIRQQLWAWVSDVALLTGSHVNTNVRLDCKFFEPLKRSLRFTDEVVIETIQKSLYGNRQAASKLTPFPGSPCCPCAPPLPTVCYVKRLLLLSDAQPITSPTAIFLGILDSLWSAGWFETRPGRLPWPRIRSRPFGPPWSLFHILARLASLSLPTNHFN